MPSSNSGSAAHIVVRPQTRSDDPLRRLLDDCGPNKHDRAIALISAAISDGVNTGPGIVDLGVQVGLNAKHVGLTLAKGRGKDPDRHHWRRDQTGVYALLS